MTQRKQVYRCYVCGNIVEVLDAGGGELHCCGAKMVLLAAKASQGGHEKHAPIIEQIQAGVRVRVGAEPHPMQPDHCIEWIEAGCDQYLCRRYLVPYGQPEAEFNLPADGLQVRVYCNKHGLWLG